MRKIHLDTDLGGDLDDLCALAMVLNWPDTLVTGITVAGDTGGKRSGYVRYALKTAGREDIPVAAGADTRSGSYRYALDLPDETRYWPAPVPASLNDPEVALDLLKTSIEQGATIAAIGPYTNLALLEKKYPGILMTADLVLMGGYIYPPPSGDPPWTNQDDFNIQVDIQSAKTVLQRASPTLVPLPVTSSTALRHAHLEALQNANPLARLIARQAQAFAVDEQMNLRYGATCPNVPTDIINTTGWPAPLPWDGAPGSR